MIRIDNLGFSYGKDLVLEHITMKLEEGRIYGLLGENGVGKTTLLTLLCGLKKPCEGSITVEGSDCETLYNPFSRKVGFLQDQYYLPDEVYGYNLTARRYAETTSKFWPRFSMENFLAVMSEFENEPDKKMNKMSAGQLKKVFISFAIATGARHIFMDEPTNGLDIPAKSQFRKALLKYTAEDATVVISTHQVRDLENVIDPIIILDSHDVLLSATLEEISHKLWFDYGNVLRNDALYREQIPGSFIQVCPNADPETMSDSKVNIEALFNAARLHKEYFKDLFAKDGGSDNE
jgi:ABC-type multidrug transport system, ATPase component